MRIPGLDLTIISEGNVVYHRTFGVINIYKDEKIDDKTIFEAASLSKPLFAYFVMKQVEKGLIDLDKPLYKYLYYPDIEHDERYKLITARHVLSHQTGLPNNWDDGKLNLSFEPGTSFLYSGAGYQYLAKIIAHVNNVPISKLESIFNKDVTIPLGAESLTYNCNTSIAKYKAVGHINGIPTNSSVNQQDLNGFGAAYSLHSNSSNYAKFLIAMVRRIGLTDNSFNELLKEHIKVPKDDLIQRVAGDISWSLGFSMQNTSKGLVYSHFGGNGDFSAYFNFYGEKNSGIVIFSNSGAIVNTDFISKIGEFLGEDIKFDVSQLD